MDDRGGRLDRVQSVGGCLIHSVAGAGAALFLLLCGVDAVKNPVELALLPIAAAGVIGALVARGTQYWTVTAAGTSLGFTANRSTAYPAPSLSCGCSPPPDGGRWRWSPVSGRNAWSSAVRRPGRPPGAR